MEHTVMEMPIRDVLEHARDLSQTRYDLDAYQTSYSVSLIQCRFPHVVELPKATGLDVLRERWCNETLGAPGVTYVYPPRPTPMSAAWSPGGRWFRTTNHWFFLDAEAAAWFRLLWRVEA
jgi:hypothetical protein